MKKSQKGFTLVELVVVIAIIGVLAAILVPSMLNYVKKSRLKTANSNAKTAYNALAENFAEAETQGYPLKDVLKADDPAPLTGEAVYKVEPDTVYIAKTDDETLEGAGGAQKVAAALAENGNESGCFMVTQGRTNGTNTYVLFWAKTQGDEMVGRYPDAIQWDTWTDLEKICTLDEGGENGLPKASYGVPADTWEDTWTTAS